MKDTLIIIIVAALLIGAGFFLGVRVPSEQPMGGLVSGHNIFDNATNSSSSVGVGAGSILSRNPNRQYASLCNYAGGIVWLYFTATDTGVVVSQGKAISSSTIHGPCYEIDSTNLYTGQIYGIADATSIIQTIEE